MKKSCIVVALILCCTVVLGMTGCGSESTTTTIAPTTIAPTTTTPEGPWDWDQWGQAVEPEARVRTGSRALAYIYWQDSSLADDYAGFLADRGFTVDVIQMDDADATDFSKYGLVIAGSDTVQFGEQPTPYISGWSVSGVPPSWGPATTKMAVNLIAESGLPVLALGSGGAGLLDFLCPGLGSYGGGSHSAIGVVDPNNPVFLQPTPLTAERLEIYDVSGSEGVSCAVADLPDSGGGVVIGVGVHAYDYEPLPPGSSVPVIAQVDRYLFWGWHEGPSRMTKDGKALFVNIVEHLLTFSSIATTSSTEAQGSENTGSGDVVYIYWQSPGLAGEYSGFLEEHGFTVDTIQMDDVATTDFSKYRLVMAGPDTVGAGGQPDGWRESGAMEPAIAVRDSGLPVLGLAFGGGALFDLLSPDIGSGAAMTFEYGGTAIEVVDPKNPVFLGPTPLTQASLQVYDPTGGAFLALPYAQAVRIARSLGLEVEGNFYPIVLEDRFLLWGWNFGPGHMTEDGQALLVNIVEYLLAL